MLANMIGMYILSVALKKHAIKIVGSKIYENKNVENTW